MVESDSGKGRAKKQDFVFRFGLKEIFHRRCSSHFCSSGSKPALIKLLSGQILCVQHDLKRVNSRARKFKIRCVSVRVSPSRNAKEQQGGDSNGGPKSGLTE
jgi:hypothetical protein